MADLKITDLADGGAVQTTDEFVVARAGANNKIAGSAVRGLVKLFESTLGANAASIDTGAGGIPSGHGDLIIFITGRTNRVSAVDTTLLLVNNDTAAHYDNEILQGAGSTTTSLNLNAGGSLTNTNLATLTGASASAGIAGALQILIPAYDGITFNKAGIVTAAVPLDSSGATVTTFAAQWRSTSAISQFSVAPGLGTLLLAGSRMVVYGTQ